MKIGTHGRRTATEDKTVADEYKATQQKMQRVRSLTVERLQHEKQLRHLFELRRCLLPNLRDDAFADIIGRTTAKLRDCKRELARLTVG